MGVSPPPLTSHPSLQLTPLPDNTLNGIPSNRTSHDQRLSRDNVLLLHGTNVGDTVDILLGRMLCNAHLTSGDTLVQTTVIPVDRRDIQVRDHVSVHCHILADLVALVVGDLLAVQLPGDLRGWVAASDTLQEDRWPRVDGLFGEALSDDGWVNWRGSNNNKSVIRLIVTPLFSPFTPPYIVLPTSVQHWPLRSPGRCG